MVSVAPRCRFMRTKKSQNRAFSAPSQRYQLSVRETWNCVVPHDGLEPLTPDVHHDAQLICNASGGHLLRALRNGLD